MFFHKYSTGKCCLTGHSQFPFSPCLLGYDVFREQKEKALTDSHEAVMILVKYLMSVVQDLQEGKELDIQTLFMQLMQV